MGKTSYNVEEADKVDVHYAKSCRFFLAIVAFCGPITIYLMRVNLSLAIVCMVAEEEETNETDEYQFDINVTDYPSQYGDFDWDRQTQGNILSSFFWGYILTQVVGGWLARKHGAKIVIFLGTMLAALSTFLSPPAARLSPYALMAARVVNGLGQGVFYPALIHLWSTWAPPMERSKLVVSSIAGTPIGSVLSFALTGLICEYMGWPWTFHLYGIEACFYCAWWLYCVYDFPATHPRITDEEREYIEQSLETGDVDIEEEKKRTVPWKSLCMSFPPHAIFVADFCRSWGHYTNLTCMPQYMSDVLEFDITTNGLMNALPHLCNFIFSLVFAQVADAIRIRGWMSTTNVRKLMQTIGLVPSAAFFIATGYLDKHLAGLAVTFLCLAEACGSATRSGHTSNMMDIAPRYAGMIMGVSNTVGNIPGALAPVVVAAITPDGTQEQWRIVFYLSAGIYLFGWVVYMIFASGEVQPWALDPEDEQIIEIPDVMSESDCKVIPKEDGVDNASFVKSIKGVL